MTDSNPTRTRYAINKQAFDDVLGDPTAKPEPIEGHYNSLRVRSSIKVAKNNFNEGHATGNPARPNVIDFTCDVEKVISTVISEENLLIRFRNTFINEFITGEIELSQEERSELEQRIGRMFLVRGISPVSRYFTAVRK